MKINWRLLITIDRGRLLFSGFLLLVSAVALLFLYFDKEKIKSEKDIFFTKGPFEEYSWIDLGGRNGSRLTFKLENYTNQFRIEADFYSVLQKSRFTAITQGDTLKIGIPKTFVKYLNTPKDQFLVYSIADANFTYLDLQKAIEEHNTPLFIYASGFFILIGSICIYFGKNKKQ